MLMNFYNVNQCANTFCLLNLTGVRKLGIITHSAIYSFSALTAYITLCQANEYKVSSGHMKSCTMNILVKHDALVEKYNLNLM